MTIMIQSFQNESCIDPLRGHIGKSFAHKHTTVISAFSLHGPNLLLIPRNIAYDMLVLPDMVAQYVHDV